MALLALGRSRCSICGEVLQPGQVIVATTHFIGDPADHLWRFSDSGMHAGRLHDISNADKDFEQVVLAPSC
jgi:hypothetical protein